MKISLLHLQVALDQPGFGAGHYRDNCREISGVSLQFRKKTKVRSLTIAGNQWLPIPMSCLETTFLKHAHLNSRSLGVESCDHPLPYAGNERLRDGVFLVWMKAGGCTSGCERKENREYHRMRLDNHFLCHPYTGTLIFPRGSLHGYARCGD